jgi:chromosome segregation ATPase
MDEAKRQIAAALNDMASGDEEAALQALRWAAAWSAEVVAAASGTNDDTNDDINEGTAALQRVILLDDALTELTRLTAAVPSVVAAAQPGPDVEAYLRARSEELAQLRDAVAASRSRLAELRRSEGELRALLAEHEQLHAQVTELRRLERLARALAELAAQRSVIEARLAELAGPVGSLERDISRGSSQLLQLTEQQRAALDPQARRALEQCAAAQAALHAAEAQFAHDQAALATAEARQDELRALRDEQVAALRAHAQSDHAVAVALADVDHVDDAGAADAAAVDRARVMLKGIEERLRELDRVLGAAILDRAAERRPIPYSSA